MLNFTGKHKVIISVTAAAIFLLLSVIISNYHIVTQTYYYTQDVSDVKRIVLITDLHGKEYGKDNEKLINMISDINPVFICLAGDFIDEDNTEEDNAEFIELLKKLNSINQTYYSYGNHDLAYLNINGFEILEKIKSTGCIILDETFVDININDTKIRLGGMYNYAFNQQFVTDELWHSSSTYKFLEDFTDTERIKILMCHRPESFIYEDASQWNIDYVFSGHTHGGIWRLPFIGGIIAPEQGFFPEYDKGEFDINNIKMIISSGLSGYKNIPRLFNSPEITIIELD